MSINSRIKKVEGIVGKDSTEGARSLVSFMIEMGAQIEDIEAAVAEFAQKGLTMHGLMKEMDGTSLGPPSLRENK